MKHLTKNSLCCGFLVILAPSALAQQSVAAPKVSESRRVSLINQSFGMDRVDGVLRAGGPNYKAIFDSDGISYTPRLGRDVPRNFPLRFSLQSIRRGSATLFAASAPVAEPSHEGMIATYGRDNGFSETYEARVDGIKQNFTFAYEPAGSGDLVVEGRITTDLVASARGQVSDGLTFTAGEFGGVTIGAVLGIDRLNHRVGGTLSFDGEYVKFVLPGEFVDGAAYPMVLDPLVGSLVTAALGGAADPDVAYNEDHDDYLIVWEHDFSAVDIDIRGQKYDHSGNLVSSAIFVTSQAGNEINPAVANVDDGGAYWVAYQVGPTIYGPWDIRGRRVDGGSATTVSAILGIASTTASETVPDVGGDNSAGGGAFDGAIVVYDDSSGISAVKVDVSSASIVAGPLKVDPVVTSTNPAICKAGGVNGRLLIVFERVGGTGGDILGELVDRDLNVLDNGVVIESNTALDSRNPDVAGDGDSFVVVYQRSEAFQSGPSDIFCRRVVWSGTSAVLPNAEVAVDSSPANDERDPAIGYLGSKYVVAWAEKDGSATLDYGISTIELNPDNCLACGRQQHTNGSLAFAADVGPEIATRWSGRATNSTVVQNDTGLIVWMDADHRPPFDSGVVGRYYEAFRGGTVTNLGGDCGNGGVSSFNGPVALGNSNLRLQVSAAGSSLLFASVQFASSATSCGPCTFNNQNSYFFTLGTVGSSSFPLAIPCDVGFLGVALHTQWAAFLSGVSPCGTIPMGAEVSFSNRLLATIGT